LTVTWARAAFSPQRRDPSVQNTKSSVALITSSLPPGKKPG
jgi:hypothetical protein